MTILLTIVLMLLVGALCFMLGAFAQESSGIFQFRDRTEEETARREIIIKVDTENLKECADEATEALKKMLAIVGEDLKDDEEDEDE